MEGKVYREDFTTEGEAISFCEGLDTAQEILDNDHLSHDCFAEGGKWVVEVTAAT